MLCRTGRQEVYTCNLYCQHHYSAFKSISLQRTPPQPHSSHIITLETISHNTPILDTPGTIYSTPTHSTTPITPNHHSNVLTSHPLLRMMLCSTNPNCHLSPLLIPEPTPHLQLFLFATTDISPYESLRIRPPPESIRFEVSTDKHW